MNSIDHERTQDENSCPGPEFIIYRDYRPVNSNHHLSPKYPLDDHIKFFDINLSPEEESFKEMYKFIDENKK